MTRPHESPECRCRACEEHDHPLRMLTVDGDRYRWDPAAKAWIGEAHIQSVKVEVELRNLGNPVEGPFIYHDERAAPQLTELKTPASSEVREIIDRHVGR